MEDRKRCQFWLPKKKRFCANLPFPNSMFCGNHTPRSDAQWIPCPIDSSHSVLQENLESHVKRCPMLKQSQSLSIQPFYQKGINAGPDKDDGERLSSASNENAIECSENVTAEMKRNAVHGLTLPQFYNLISKIKSLHESVCKDIVDSYRTPEACDMWIKGEVDGKVPFQEKHVMQQVSILGNLEELGVLKSNSCDSEKRLMDDNEKNDVPAVVEFGAGRGYLTQLLADCYGIKRVFLVERKSYKLKADRSLRQKESLVLERLRIDIEDLNLSGVESLKGLPFMAIGKHLCGPATDLTLRCCLAEEFVHSNNQKCRIKGLAIATCCHHLCQWKHYTNKRYLLDLGIEKDEFHAITWFTSWAVDADHGSDLPDINNGSTLQPPSSIEQKKPQSGEEPTRVEDMIKEMKASERAVVGLMCKQIIDIGRLMWVKEHGLVGRLVKYHVMPRASSVPTSCYKLNTTRYKSYNLILIHLTCSLSTFFSFQTSLRTLEMDNPTGTVIFTSIGRPYYGFDVFSLHLSSTQERRLTDGRSINFNAQFVDDHHTVVYISERSGSAQIFLSRRGVPEPQPLPCAPGSLFHDRPVINNDRLFFISAHEKPDQPFRSWSALYVADIGGKELTRLTPYGCADYSPAVSRSGKLVAVASNGSRPWGGEFHELHTEIVVFPESNPEKRTVVAERGGWPSWSGDSVIFFHRQNDDGWWSIFSVDVPDDLVLPLAPVRLTPPGVHCFTPAAMDGGKRIVIATRRRGRSYRHIEIFDLESRTFHPVTETLNPNLHHYNPFVSPDSESIGYHRFRGESTDGDLTVPHLDPVVSPVEPLRMLRMNGSFPSVSPSGDLIACNLDFEPPHSGVDVVRSDGSRRWTILKNRIAFYNSWSPTEKNVIYTSIGPIFQSAKTTVQIARLTFDSSNMDGDDEEIPCDVKILTREETGNNAFCHCSPDGSSLVFRSGRTGHKNLYILDSVNGEFDGGSIRQLTDGPWIDTMPSWSPRGDLIAFSSNRHNPNDTNGFSIYLIRPDGSGLRRMYVAGPEGSSEVDRERINHVCFSGDGEWLLFTANLGGVVSEPVSMPNQFQPYGDLYVVRLDGSGLRRLTWNGYENGTPTWYPGDEVDTGRLKSSGSGGGGYKMGQFDEPLWISCDIE